MYVIVASLIGQEVAAQTVNLLLFSSRPVKAFKFITVREISISLNINRSPIKQFLWSLFSRVAGKTGNGLQLPTCRRAVRFSVTEFSEVNFVALH